MIPTAMLFLLAASSASAAVISNVTSRATNQYCSTITAMTSGHCAIAVAWKEDQFNSVAAVQVFDHTCVQRAYAPDMPYSYTVDHVGDFQSLALPHGTLVITDIFPSALKGGTSPYKHPNLQFCWGAKCTENWISSFPGDDNISKGCKCYDKCADGSDNCCSCGFACPALGGK